MSETYDIVTVGSGHNGLVAAAYLACAGKEVLVLEKNPWFGGGVITRELTVPGFKHDQHSMAHIFIQANPLIKDDELGLISKYGLKYIYPEIPLMSVFQDGETLSLYTNRQKNYDEIARFSKEDAESYLRLSQLGETYLPAIVSGMFSIPAPTGAMYAFMDSSREGRQMMNIMLKSAYDIVTEYFKNDRVLLHFTRMVSENLTGPEEKGTGIGLFVFLAFLEKYGIGVAEGGSGMLSQSLIRCIEDHGGKVVGGVEIDKILVKNGRAVGARANDGREFLARDGVIGSIHPHDIGKMVEGVDPVISGDAARVKLTENVVFTVHAALNEPLKFKAGDKCRKAMMIELLPDSINTLRGHFDDLRYGRIPRDSLIGLGSVSNIDPSRAPAGKATMHAWDYVPYEHPKGGAKHWDACKIDFAEEMIGKMGAYISNLNHDNIIKYHCDSPLDMERHSASFRKGDIHGVAFDLVQNGAHRPTPELGQNMVPGIERFYLVGPFQHPGGGVFGAGRASAMKAFEDLGLDVDKIN
jgi:phytoene dehydrogenase-like protein